MTRLLLLLLLLLAPLARAAFSDNYNWEAQVWRRQVRTNSSDVASTSYVSSVVLMQHLKQWALRPKIASMGIYTGTSTGAVFMAMVHDLPNMNASVNQNFASGDYTESTGLTGNGSTKRISLSTAGGGTVTMSQLTQFAHVGVYCRTPTNTFSHVIGASDAGSDSSAYVLIDFSGVTYGQVNDTVALQWSAADTNGTGFYVATRTATNFAAVYRNGIQQSSQTGNLSGNHNAPETIFVHALNADGSVSGPSDRTLSFWTVGYGLTPTDNLNYYKAVQRHQLRLGRAIAP